MEKQSCNCDRGYICAKLYRPKSVEWLIANRRKTKLEAVYEHNQEKVYVGSDFWFKCPCQGGRSDSNGELWRPDFERWYKLV